MRRIGNITLITLALLTLLGLMSSRARAADVLTPSLLKLSIYTNLPGGNVAEFTSDATYPASPGEVRFLRSFNTRDAAPTDALQNFGGRVEGFVTPQESGEFIFFLSSDSASQLWLGSNESESTASQIAEELDRGDPFMEPDTGDLATSAPIPLTAGKRYFIMVLYKGNALAGNDTDYAKVAWRKVGDTTPAATLKPIPAAFLSTMADPAKAPKFSITQQPANVTAEENSRATLSVAIDLPATNYVCIQWQRNGVSIPDATGTNYVRFMDKADNGAKFRALISVPGASVTSTEITATISEDKTKPTLTAAKGGPNRPEVLLTFSERVSPASATTVANYKIASPNGTALGVTDAILSADRTQVTLKTAAQTFGTEYTVTVNSLADVAVTPNTITANSQIKFFARGPLLQGADGFVIWEAEDYDRNLDGLWVEDIERGLASGGVSMVNRNGAGGSENNTKLEYDIYFPKAGTNIIWWRFSGNDGNDDSAIIHLDGARPVAREAGNLAVIGGTGTSLTSAWGWIAAPFEGGGQMTFVIETPGVHSIAIARREDGSYVDKFVITTDPNFNPTTGFGVLGPGSTLRQGEPLPPGAAVQITAQPVSSNGVENTSLTLSAAASIPTGFLFTYQWQRKQGASFVDLPGLTGTNLVLNPLTMDWNGAVVRMRVIAAGDVQYTGEATITVAPETIPPELVRATGSALKSEAVIVFSEAVTQASGQNVSNYKIAAASGAALTVQSAVLMPNGRTVVLTTGAQTVGTKYTVTINGVVDTAAKPNPLVNGQIRFYSLGARQPEGADGLLVWEAEDYDRNLGDLWVVNRLRATPSTGASVVAPNGSGSAEVNKVEYDLTFTKTGIHILWYRASSDSGSDDSAWLHVDGARPPNRTAANQASMTGYNSIPDFVWRSNPQDGGGQMTFDIPTAGVHAIGLALREDGAFFDKFAITTDPTFNPNNYGPFGPPETRAGAPALPTILISSPLTNSQFNAGVEIPVTVQVSATTRVITKVEFLLGATKLGETTASPYNFTWQNAPVGTNNITARVVDDVSDSVQSLPVAVIVTQAQGVSLTAARGATGVTLTWTGGTGPYVVQKKSSLSDAAWVDVLTTSDLTATVPFAGATGFFRVRAP